MYKEVEQTPQVVHHTDRHKAPPRYGGEMFLPPLRLKGARQLQHLRQRLLLVEQPTPPHPLQQVTHRLLKKEPRGAGQKKPPPLLQLHQLVPHRKLPEGTLEKRERATPLFNLWTNKTGPLLKAVGQLPPT